MLAGHFRRSSPRLLRICDFGDKLVPYAQALAWQEKLAKECKEGHIPDTLLQLQHHEVYTLGKRGRFEDFRTPPEALRSFGAEICNVGRGGETTFHGPGQIVMYPIVNLRRLGVGPRAYVEGLEDTIIACLQQFGIHAQANVIKQPVFKSAKDQALEYSAMVLSLDCRTAVRPSPLHLSAIVVATCSSIPGRKEGGGFPELGLASACCIHSGTLIQGRQPKRTGVWVGDEKIAAIGVQISAGIARHGLALNVATSLSHFDHIVPCGLPDFKVTSIQALNKQPDMELCSQILRHAFKIQFRYESVEDIAPQEVC